MCNKRCAAPCEILLKKEVGSSCKCLHWSISQYGKQLSLGAGGLLGSTWLVIVLDVFESPQTSCCTTTTLTDSTQQQQQRMTRNSHNHFCNKSENFWMARKQRERGGWRGGIVCGSELPCVAGAGQTNGESNWGLISRRMHRQSSAGLRSKWELVHYGSAARYFTAELEIG